MCLRFNLAINRTIRKYYFNNATTLLIPFFFLGLFIVILLQQSPFFSIKNLIIAKNWGDLINSATGIYAFLIFTVFVGLFLLLRKFIKWVIEPDPLGVKPFIIERVNFDKEKEEENLFPRDKQEKELTYFLDNTFEVEKKKYAFFVGKSGSGKSLLLGAYKEKKNRKNVIIKFVSDYTTQYSVKNKLQRIAKECIVENMPCIIIFDQFERALENIDIFQYIKTFLCELTKAEIQFIFVCTNDGYDEVLKRFQVKTDLCNELRRFEFNTNTYNTLFLSVLPEDAEQIKECLKQDLKHPGETSVFYEFIDSLIYEFQSDSTSMIEINIVRSYLKRKSIYDDELLKQDDAKEKIIKKYFEKLLLSSNDPDLAIIILYSISQCKYTEGLTISDFKNLTFASAENINKILSLLIDQKIIKQIRDTQDSPCVMMHDYLKEFFKVHFIDKLDPRLKPALELYCTEREKWIKKDIKKRKMEKEINNEGNEVENLYITPLSLYYQNYQNTMKKKISSSMLINICMMLLYIVILAVCVLYEAKGYDIRCIPYLEYEWNNLICAFTVLAIFSAIFYIYHYLYYFAKIFLNKNNKKKNVKQPEFYICYLLIFWGMASVILALLINGLWVSWLAIEWLLIGSLHLVLSGKVKSNEEAKFTLIKEGISYLIIAFVLMGLNVLVIFRFGGHMLPWLIVFTALVMFIIHKHINSGFMLAKLVNFSILKFEEDFKND
jgi:hypothetical protein